MPTFIKVRFLRNLETSEQGLYDDDNNLLASLPPDFEVSFFDDINIRNCKKLGLKLTHSYDYSQLTTNYYLKV